MLIRTLSLTLFSLSLTGLAFAAKDLPCGYRTIPAAALAGYAGAQCVGVGANGDMVIQGQNEQTLVESIRLLSAKYNSEKRAYDFKVVAEIAKSSSKALQEYCGRALDTARILTRKANRVLLIYSEATVVEWDTAANSVREIATRIDPNSASICGGSDSGPNALVDRMLFRESERGSFLLFDLGGELVRVDL